MRQIGRGPTVPGTGDLSLEALNSLFAREGSEEITTTTIDVTRTFSDFDDFWRAQTPIFNLYRDDYGIAGEPPCETDRVSAGGGASWSWRPVAH